MLPSRSIAFMTLVLSCIFSSTAVAGVILLPSFLPSPTIEVSSSPEPLPDPISEPRTPSTLLFIGDLMLARGVEWRIGKNDLLYPLGDITSDLSAADLTIGNFEGTIRDEPNQELDGFTFDTTPEITGILATAGIDVLSLSNNHSNNYGSKIVQYTREIISELGMVPFGDPYDSGSFVAHVNVNNLPISFIGFHAFGEDPESILDVITEEKSLGNFTIIFAHWGNEYEFTPSTAQTAAAHMFVDAGADAVIGAHPHVIQTYEQYQGIPIIYSLGNFLFDQDWSVPTQQGLMLEFMISDENIAMKFIPISVIKSHVTKMEPLDALNILSQHNLPATLTISR